LNFASYSSLLGDFLIALYLGSPAQVCSGYVVEPPLLLDLDLDPADVEVIPLLFHLPAAGGSETSSMYLDRTGSIS